MKKVKIISIMIVTLLISIGAVSVSGTNTLDGHIDVEVTQFFMGLVHPRINLANESDIAFIAEPVTQNNLSFFRVNDSITIDLDVTDNSGKDEYMFSRSVFYSAIIVRKPVINMKVGGYFKRMFPAFELLKPAKVVSSTLGGNRTTEIVIPINYTIAKETIEPEEMTLHFVTFGMLPGDINGIEGLHVISYKKVTLNVDYVAIL